MVSDFLFLALFKMGGEIFLFYPQKYTSTSSVTSGLRLAEASLAFLGFVLFEVSLNVFSFYLKTKDWVLF